MQREPTSANLATRLIVLGSSMTLGFPLEAEQMWQLMERKFGFTSTEAHRTEVAVFDDSLLNPMEAVEAIMATLRPVREWIKTRHVSLYVLMPGKTLPTGANPVTHPTTVQWRQFWKSLGERITRDDETREWSMVKPSFLLPMETTDTQVEIEAEVNYLGPFQGTIVVFSPELSDLWLRRERSLIKSGAPSNEDTIQLWSFGFQQMGRAMLLNYFAKIPLGE